jgi:HEAT repeat protein
LLPVPARAGIRGEMPGLLQAAAAFLQQGVTSMPRIFLSYRRDDTGYVARMLAEKLSAEFGPDAIFMDIDNIPFGADFRQYIVSAVHGSHVLLALIGDNWLAAVNPDGSRRLDDPSDYVRIEISSAIQRGIPVIPVLAGKAKMPSERDLPPALGALAFRNAADLRAGRDLPAQLHTLIDGLRSVLSTSTGSSVGPASKTTPQNSPRPQPGTTAQQQGPSAHQPIPASPHLAPVEPVEVGASKERKPDVPGPIQANQDVSPDQLLKQFRDKHPDVIELIDLVIPGGGDLTVAVLKSAIRHANWHVRRASTVLFGKLGPTGKVGVTVLVEALTDSEAEIRQASQESLSLIDWNWASSSLAFEGIPFLRSQLTHTQNDVRQAAAEVLGTLGEGARVAISDLVVSLVDNHEPVRRTAGLALGQITSNWPSSIQAHQAVPKLIETLRNTREEVRGAAIATLGIIRPGADEHLRALADNMWAGPIESRLAAMAVLARIGTASRPVSPYIAANLVDPEARIRKVAEDTLNIVDPNWPQHPEIKEMLPQLVELLNHSDGGVRARAAAFIGDYLPIPEAAPPLAAAELDQDQSVRKAAGEAFARLPQKATATRYTQRSVERLIIALNHTFSQLRLHALFKLEWLGTEANGAIGSIIPMIADEDQSVRQAAEKCLNAIDRDWNLNPSMQEAALKLVEILKDLPDNTDTQQARRECIVKVLGGLGSHGSFLVERLIPLLKFDVPARKVTVDRRYLCGISGESSDHDYTYAFGIERAAAQILGAYGTLSRAAIPHLIANVQHSDFYCQETARQSVASLDMIDPMWPENYLNEGSIYHFSSRILDEKMGDLYWKICTRLTGKSYIAARAYEKSGINSGRMTDVVLRARFLADLGAVSAFAIPEIEKHCKRLRSNEAFYRRGGNSWQLGQAELAKTQAAELRAAVQRIRDAAKEAGVPTGSIWSRIFGS